MPIFALNLLQEFIAKQFVTLYGFAICKNLSTSLLNKLLITGFSFIPAQIPIWARHLPLLRAESQGLCKAPGTRTHPTIWEFVEPMMLG